MSGPSWEDDVDSRWADQVRESYSGVSDAMERQQHGGQGGGSGGGCFPPFLLSVGALGLFIIRSVRKV